MVELDDYLRRVTPALKGTPIADQLALGPGLRQGIAYVVRTAETEHWSAQRILDSLARVLEKTGAMDQT